MKKILLENGLETKEAYIAGNGEIFQSDPDPKMLGYSRIFMSKQEANDRGYVIVDVSCKGPQ